MTERRTSKRLGRPPGPTVGRDVRREQLLDAAARAIRTFGADTSMEVIAAEAGISKPILYDHFGDKAGLAEALASRFAHDLSEALSALSSSTGAPLERTRESVIAFVDFVEREPEVYRFLVQGAVTSGARLVPQRKLIAMLGRQAGRSIEAGTGPAGVDGFRAESWGFATIGAVFMAIEWWQAERRIDRETLIDSLTAFLWGGLSRADRHLLTGQPLP